MKLAIYSIILIGLISCKQETKQVNTNQRQKASTQTQTINAEGKKTSFEKSIKLKYGFDVNLDKSEDLGSCKVYSYFQLSKLGTTIYTDTNPNCEYEFTDHKYPIIIQTSRNKYELLFEVNNRPNKNVLKCITVCNNKVCSLDTLPTFISEASDLDNDGIKEYAGYWDEFEEWGDSSNTSVAYNPILYYKITKKGIKLDVALTIKMNKKIYGAFLGFKYNEGIPVQEKLILSKFDKECKRIGNTKS